MRSTVRTIFLLAAIGFLLGCGFRGELVPPTPEKPQPTEETAGTGKH